MTAGRDGAVRIWQIESDGLMNELNCYMEHEGFVNSVAFIPETTEYPEGRKQRIFILFKFVLGVILSGGVDKLINVWDCAKGALCGSLISHSENICKLIVFPTDLKTSPFEFGSSSWDGSARCWTEELSPAGTLTLKPDGPVSTCWSVAALGRDAFVTAHADRSIKLWRGERQVQVINSAHRDVVRDLCTLPGNCFVSAGNDGALKVWDSSTGSEIQNIQMAHPAFIYGLSWNGTDRLVSFGEEGIVKIWKWIASDRKLREEQTLRVPMMSSWCASFSDAETLIVGGSTGTLFTFSARLKESAIVEVYEAEMRAFDEAAKASKASEIAKNCQDESVLKYPGERVGKTILVRRGGDEQIEAHQWDGQEWQNLGAVLDPLSVKAPDFTFNVELDDTGKSYSLSYSWGENPYSVAKNFLERNELPIGYLDQVANFIVKNAGPSPEIPEQKPESSYSDSDGKPEPEPFRIEAYNSDGVVGKLKAFGFEGEINEKEICQVLSKWPIDKLFPCLDWLRFHVLKSGNVSCLESVPFDAILSGGNGGKEAAAGITMSLRLLCNVTSLQTPVDSNLIVKVIGKCTNSPAMQTNSSTWIPLLIGLLSNASSLIEDDTKRMALLQGILLKAATLNEDSITRIWWLVKETSKPIPLATSLKVEFERIPGLREILKIFNQ